MLTLMEEIKITKVADASAAALTTINSAPIDMAGFDGCVFLTNSGTVLATGTALVKVQQDTVVGMGTAADLLASGQAFVAGNNNLSVAVDLRRPIKRFLRLVITRAVAMSDWGPVYALQYRAKKKPVTQGLDRSKLMNSPAEGTA